MIGTCRTCGCTDDRACPGSCWWVEADLCSTCAAAEVEEACAGPALPWWDLPVLVRMIPGELRHAGMLAGYWLRPYDMTRNRRRWRWQQRGCLGLWRRP